MSPVEYRFLEPLDVLFLRGNKLFGDPGSFGESLIPPWPSVAAGALRSRLLADEAVDLAAFAQGEISHPALGTPEEPGPFTVTAFTLGRRLIDGTVEPLFVPPADLVLSRDDAGILQVRVLTPTPLSEGNEQHGRASILSSAPLPLLPVLADAERSKPVTGYWLTAGGWDRYLRGKAPSVEDFIPSSWLWAIDPRVGVGLETATRRAADGRLFSVQAVAMTKQGSRVGVERQSGKPILSDYDVGFLVGVAGADLPNSGILRLGGDGRAAAVRPVAVTRLKPDYDTIVAARRCRLVLTTPGLFSTPLPWEGTGPGVRAGWLPTGTRTSGDRAFRFDLHGVKGRLVCAAVPRAEVVSGWDLARWAPKPAQRAAPTGSVYWLDDLEATPDALRKLVERGVWKEPCEDAARRAEGFNRVGLAVW